MFTSYDTVHKHFKKVYTHLYIVHTLFTRYNIVHSHFDTGHSMFTHTLT